MDFLKINAENNRWSACSDDQQGCQQCSQAVRLCVHSPHLTWQDLTSSMCHYEAPFLCCTIVTFNSRASRSPDPEPSNHSQMKVQMKSQPTLHTKDPIWKKQEGHAMSCIYCMQINSQCSMPSCSLRPIWKHWRPTSCTNPMNWSSFCSRVYPRSQLLAGGIVWAGGPKPCHGSFDQLNSQAFVDSCRMPRTNSLSDSINVGTSSICLELVAWTIHIVQWLQVIYCLWSLLPWTFQRFSI